MADVEHALAYARSHRERTVRDVMRFVRIPSISVQPTHAGDVRRCAGWLANHLRRIGLERVRIVPTALHPLVLGDWRHAPDRPTILIYGHYDVQPVDPVGEWRTPPFAPAVRDDYLHGRGASDDKGQLFAHLAALEAYLRTAGQLPVNVVCLFEGEEEIGSPHLRPFLLRHGRQLGADAAAVSDTRMLGPTRPAITYAMRGALGMEVEVHGPARDLHSGQFGGAVYDPLQALCEIIAGLHDERRRVAIPGFYDRVRRLDDREQLAMRRAGPSDAEVLRQAGTRATWGELGYTLYERLTIRPALTVNGIAGGYQGTGGKAVIPACALAKLSFRLVPDQDPAEIEPLVLHHLTRAMPVGLRSVVRTQQMARPVVLDRRHPALAAAARAYRRGFGVVPTFVRSGGTIPVAHTFQELLGIPTVLMGFALPEDGAHAPNERFHLPTFFRAIDTCIWFLRECAAAPWYVPHLSVSPEHPRAVCDQAAHAGVRVTV